MLRTFPVPTVTALALAMTMLAAPSVRTQARVPARATRIPRTADGHPDFQGTWSNSTLTPFERPAGFENKPFLTEAEAADVERRAAERAANPPEPRPGDVGTDNEAFVDSGYKVTVTRQASLVVDPPDGHIPFRPAVEATRQFNLTSMADPETMSPWDRCITRSPTLLVGAGYNNGYEIVQTGGHVVVLAEMVHEARIIPTDGRPHVDSRERMWTGDSRGRWQGDTLVVDTTNFRDGGWISTQSASGRLRGVPHTSQLHLTERFTLRDSNTLIYELTIDDPPIYTRPFTVMVPFTRDENYVIYEYACHEGNRAIENFLRGARDEERRGKK
jgi:hypothetical protein